MGDGINSLIILTYQLFLCEPGSWVFIEEPELNLHPGLQRVFLQTLVENPVLRKRNLRVFLTTHSNHLLRMTLRDELAAEPDISVFAFQERAEDKAFLIRPLVSEQHQALALLGVQNASVLLAQCGVWVEGVTDRIYLRAYLKAYLDFLESTDFKAENSRIVLKEDAHYAFWEYAGSNLAHYFDLDGDEKPKRLSSWQKKLDEETLKRIESSALCNRIFLLSDQDKNKEAKHKALRAIKRDNFQYFMTPGVEVENLISAELLKACLPSLFSIATKDTERIAALAQIQFDENDYKNEHLGTFLKKKFPDACPAELPDKKTGTLSSYYKNKLPELVASHVKWDNMSASAKDLIRNLYRFLARHNEI